MNESCEEKSSSSSGIRSNVFQTGELLLDQAEEHAPAALSNDIATFAAAIDHYVVALADADYDLDVIFSTPKAHGSLRTPRTRSHPT